MGPSRSVCISVNGLQSVAIVDGHVVTESVARGVVEWIAEHADAIVAAFYGGEYAGQALADVVRKLLPRVVVASSPDWP